MARLYSRALSLDEVAGQFVEGVRRTVALPGQPSAERGLWNARGLHFVFLSFLMNIECVI